MKKLFLNHICYLFYEDKGLQDVMKKFYQIKLILLIFSKIRIDISLKFSVCTYILISYPMIYHTSL